MEGYTDLTVKVRMLTRTCQDCSATGEFPYVRAEMGGGDVPTWREAERKREAWWEAHKVKCVPARALLITA